MPPSKVDSASSEARAEAARRAAEAQRRAAEAAKAATAKVSQPQAKGSKAVSEFSTGQGLALRSFATKGLRRPDRDDGVGSIGAAPVDVGSLLTNPAFSNTERDNLQKARSGALGPEAKTNFDMLVGASGFPTLPQGTQVQLLRRLAESPASNVSNGLLAGLARSYNFGALSSSQQTQVLGIFDKADPGGRGQLVELTNRSVNGRPALLDVDAKGGSLLNSLSAFTTSELSPAFASNGVTREVLLYELLQESSTPGQINQSNRGTCSVTSMQYLLCERNPAEYVRLMQGLLGPSGKVPLHNGDTLTRVGDSIAKDSAVDRSSTERIFQSAMMDYSNGSDNYSNVDSANNPRIFGINIGILKADGLGSGEQERGMTGLFGKKTTYYPGDFNFRDDGPEVIAKLRSRMPTHTLTDINWGSGSHVIVTTRVENGRVYFRNPWGATADPVGTNYNDPPRRLENGAIREESMSEADFARWVKGCYIEG